jgi:hypothetical protein
MTPAKTLRTVLRTLAALAILAAFAVLDWYPSVKELGRLRRQRSDLQRTIKDHEAMAARFAFPGQEEIAQMAAAEAELRRSLLQLDRDDAWEALAVAELRSRAAADGIRGARVFSAPLAAGDDLAAASGKPAQSGVWFVRGQAAAIADAFSLAVDPLRFHWRGLYAGLPGLACRPLGVVAAAPLPALLDFINHIPWGEARLEIVRLHLEPGTPLARAWLVCRGSYLARQPSRWAMAKEAASGDGLLVDPDSPLLLKGVDPGLAPQGGKEELPPDPSRRDNAAGSPW